MMIMLKYFFREWESHVNSAAGGAGGAGISGGGLQSTINRYPNNSNGKYRALYEHSFFLLCLIAFHYLDAMVINSLLLLSLLLHALLLLL